MKHSAKTPDRQAASITPDPKPSAAVGRGVFVTSPETTLESVLPAFSDRRTSPPLETPKLSEAIVAAFCGPPTGGRPAPGGAPPGSTPADPASLLIHRNKSSTSRNPLKNKGKRDPVDSPDEPQNIDRTNDRLNRYAKAHRSALEIARFIRSVDPASETAQGRPTKRIADQLTECGTWLEFRRWIQTGESQLTAANFCGRPKACPLCAIRRACKSIPRYLERVEHVTSAAPGLSVQMFTSTVKDGPGLLERLDHLEDANRRLWWRRTNRRRGSYSSTEFRHVVGAVRSTEIKRGRNSGLWHPHTHWLVLTEQRLDAAKLSAEWRDITGDSFIVDVTDVTDPASGLVEVLKYALKFSSMDPADVWHADTATIGRRLLRSCGNLYGVKIPDDLLDEPLDDQDGEYIDEFFLFDSQSESYHASPKWSTLSPNGTPTDHRDHPVAGRETAGPSRQEERSHPITPGTDLP